MEGCTIVLANPWMLGHCLVAFSFPFTVSRLEHWAAPSPPTHLLVMLGTCFLLLPLKIFFEHGREIGKSSLDC